MTDSPSLRPVVLCILDGWGEREETDFNAVAAADTPVWDRLRATCPRARLDASGGEVGLPTLIATRRKLLTRLSYTAALQLAALIKSR